MSDKPLSIEQILTLLEAGPARIAQSSAGLTAVQLRTPLLADEWSARDVLAHLRACADMWGNSIRLILAEDQPTFKAMNPTTWVKQTDYLQQEFQPSLQAFADQRAGLLKVLKLLPAEAWFRTATVTGAGKPIQRSVQSYAQWLATHERSHLKQIERITTALRNA